jgi:hypothetical protein
MCSIDVQQLLHQTSLAAQAAAAVCMPGVLHSCKKNGFATSRV